MTPSAGEPWSVDVLDTITGPDTLNQIRHALQWLSSPESGLSEESSMHLAMAVDEIGANIVQHARHGQPVRMRLQFRVRPAEVEVVFCDDGDAANVDLSNVHLPELMAERGRGLAIAKSCLDQLAYRRENATNYWSLTIKR